MERVRAGSWCRQNLSPDGGWLLLTVSDNGEGIRQENLSKIFDPFFTTKPEGKGRRARAGRFIRHRGGARRRGRGEEQGGRRDHLHGEAAAGCAGRRCESRWWRMREPTVQATCIRAIGAVMEEDLAAIEIGVAAGTRGEDASLGPAPGARLRSGSAPGPVQFGGSDAGVCRGGAGRESESGGHHESGSVYSGADLRLRAGATGTDGWRWFRWRDCGRSFTRCRRITACWWPAP